MAAKSSANNSVCVIAVGICRNIMLCFCLRGCAAVLAFVVLVGCSGEGSKGTVEGTVTLNGQPLEKGLIRFVPVDGNSQPADGTIAGGKFTVIAPVGDFRVEITSPRVVGQAKMYDTPDSPTVDKIAEAIPAKYNVQTELQMTVSKGKTENKQFDLTSP
jgi:hypothetical protein